MSWFAPSEGFVRCGSGLGGHASISDDGSGNVVIAAGVQLLVDEGTNSAPGIARNGTPNNGIRMRASSVQMQIAGGTELTVQNSTVNLGTTLSLPQPLIFQPSADQSITGVGSTFLRNSSHIKITSDGVYTLTTAMAAGTDGQVVTIENVSANAVTLQEGPVVAQGSPIQMIYSSDAVAWEQL